MFTFIVDDFIQERHTHFVIEPKILIVYNAKWEDDKYTVMKEINETQVNNIISNYGDKW